MSDWLSKYVDFKVLINLEERTDRYNETVLEFEKIGISDIHHFLAVKHRLGPSGCARSHYEIIKMARANNYKNVLIFEDDVYFEGSVESIKENLLSCFNQIETHNISPDFLYLGGRLTTPPDGNFHKSTMQYHSKIDSNLYELGGCKTTHAYIIFESVYDKIISEFENIDWDDINVWQGNNRMNIDYWYLSRLFHDGYSKHDNINHRKFTPYGVYPCIAGQRESYSDIQHKTEAFIDMPKQWNQMLEKLND